MGRSWVSEPGNLYATFLFPLAAGPDVAAQASFVAALAVHDTVTALLPDLAPRIKWPNDVLIGGAKVCGVLPEVVGDRPLRIAIGCGLNIAHAPEGTPYPVAALDAGSRHGLSVETVFAALDSTLTRRLAQWDAGRGFASIRADWSARALGLGGSVSTTSETQSLSGTFKGLAADGALLLEDATGRVTPIHSGEVRFAELEALRQGNP